MNVPDNLRYTQEHEWVLLDGGRARVGITDYAQDALGDVVYVDLPQVGAELHAMAVCCEVESTKSVSEIYAPVAGVVVEVNTALEATPELLNADPYGDGWIFVLECAAATDTAALLDASAYRALTEDG